MCNDGENTGQTDVFERATQALRETRVPDDPSSLLLANLLVSSKKLLVAGNCWQE